MSSNNDYTEEYTKYLKKKSFPHFIKNEDFNTIEFDNYDDTMLSIENADIARLDNNGLTNNQYNTCVLLIYYIEFAKQFYIKPTNKPSWIKYNNIKDNSVKAGLNLAKLSDIFLPTYVMYYQIKACKVMLKNMKVDINNMFSDDNKYKEIEQNPLYNKGKNYYLHSIKAAQTMLNELSIIIKCYIKIIKFKLLYDTPFSSENINTIFLHIHGREKLIIDEIPIEERQSYYKSINIEIYNKILDILTPSTFYNLYLKLGRYSFDLKKKVYLDNLINNKENPTFIGFDIDI